MTGLLGSTQPSVFKLHQLRGEGSKIVKIDIKEGGGVPPENVLNLLCALSSDAFY